MSQDDSDHSVDALFSQYLELYAVGAVEGIESFVREHPAHASDLRAQAESWERLDGILNAGLSRPALDADGGGQSIGRYRLDGEVGRGGMGTVWRVWDSKLRRLLALKVVAEERPTVDVEGRRSRFLMEAQITAQLDHPGIAPVHELGADEHGRAYFTMKLVDGETLARVLERWVEGDGTWSRERILGLLVRVCEAVAYAHERSVVHRDLKPQNIMIGRFGEVYVMDWGLARVAGDNDVGVEPAYASPDLDAREDARATRDGEVLGTPAYMAPEQARAENASLTPAADVYAVGAMLYELLTRTPPYADRARDRVAIWRDALATPPTPIAELEPNAPEELVSICERAMAREPELRYASMLDLAADLRAHLEERVVRAHASGAWIEAKKWVRRNTGWAWTAALLVLAVLTGMAGIALTEARGRRLADEERTLLAGALGFLRDMLSAPSPGTDGPNVRVAEVLERAAEGLRNGERSAVRPRLEGLLNLMVGETYLALSMDEQAVPHLERAVEAGVTQVQGSSDPRLALAQAYAGVADPRAEALALEAHQSQQRRYGSDSPEAVLGLIARVRVAHRQNDFAAMLELARAGLELAPVASVKSDDMRDARVWLQVAVSTATSRLGDPGGALEAIEGVALSEDPLREAQLRINRVQPLLETGRIEEALELLPSAVTAIEAHAGRDHDLAFAARRSFASALRAAGRGEEAVDMLWELVERGVELHGLEHPITLRAAQSLAAALHEAGALADAGEFLHDVLDAHLATFGPDDERSVRSRLWLATGLWNSGDLDGAEEHLREIASRFRTLPATTQQSLGDAVDVWTVFETETGRAIESGADAERE